MVSMFLIPIFKEPVNKTILLGRGVVYNVSAPGRDIIGRL